MQDAYAEDRYGRRRKIKKGDVLRDGEVAVIPATLMDSQLRLGALPRPQLGQMQRNTRATGRFAGLLTNAPA